MTFSEHDLPGRASDLLAAQKDALEDHGEDCDQYDIPSDEILGIYDDFASLPSPDNFGTYTDGLLTTMEKLATGGYSTGQTDGSTGVASSVLDLTISAGDEVDDWTGKGADQFNIWTDGWKTGVSNQFAATVALRILLNAEAAVWTGVLKDLDDLSNAATKAMKAVTECNGDDVTIALSVATAVVGIAAAIPTAGTSLSLVAVAGAGLGVASTGMQVYDAASKPEPKISSCCPRCCIDDVKDALKDIKTHTREAEEKIAKDLDKNINIINGAWSEFCKPAPALGSVPRKNVHGYDGLGSFPG